ncbi:BTAD domain-containing putative transcriptional regulator [Streptomyces laurentii]|uniref:BTAD domain-containing putative transcriptional regulator n=1 Tax=Streptomyces laurentii TaxID=39478 RepID=UPI00367B8A6B
MRYSVLGPTRAHTSDGTQGRTAPSGAPAPGADASAPPAGDGAPVAAVSGAPVAVGGPRVRALLTVLALRAGRPVPVGVLVDEVWGAEPPADAVAALQALVGRLRRALGHERVVSADGGYRLAAAPEDVDAHRFTRLAADGVRELDAGRPGRAAALLDEALALWTGPALADLPDRAAEAARWETRRLGARRARLAAALALGEGDAVLPELDALGAEHPLDEPLQALRIRALAAAGRPAEALAVYETVRRGLADRLGADPSPELRSLHAALLKGRGDGRSATAGPGPGGRGGGNLRARLTSFVGREDDLAALRDALGGTRLVTLLGPGGAGKTRLSQEAAERAAGQWPDGAWFVELAPVTDPEAVTEAVLDALGARETVLRGAGAEELRHPEDAAGRLVEHCAGRRLLLILDNCEHVVGAVAELAERVLARCPGVTVLATSREPLGVPGESTLPVGPLPRDTAVRLFGERGAAVRPGFRVADDEAAADEIVRRLDGLPLAIELAAARLRLLTPRQIADRLDDRFRLLTSGARTVLPRQQTLRAVVDWSWDLLDAPERAVLRRLAIFTGGCDLEAAEDVCAGPVVGEGAGPGAVAAVAASDVLDLLGSLVDKSLVVAAEDGTGMRYGLLETVAEYAAERLDEAGEREAAERRHLVHYREFARRTDPELRTGRQATAMARFAAEYGNLRTALRTAVRLRDEHEGLILVHALLWYWTMRDLRADALHWAESVSALGPDPFGPSAAPVVPLHEPCTAAPPPLGEDQLWEARRGVRLIELLNMDYENGFWVSPDGLARLRLITGAYPPGLPQVCRMPGSLTVFATILTGETGHMHAALDANVDTCRRLGHDWELANALQMRANMLANRAVWAGRAAADADEALEIFVRLDDAWGAAEALSSRGEARERRLEFAGAAEDFEAAIEYARRIGAQSQMGLLRARYADMLAETGRREEAERILREVVDGEYGRSHPPTLAARIFLAILLARTGRTGEARGYLTQLLEEFSTEAFSLFEGFTIGSLAWLDDLDGDYAAGLVRARQAYDSALGTLSRTVAPEMPAAHLVTAAWALAGLGGRERARTAAMLLGAYERLLPPHHLAPPVERENRERATALTRTALADDAAFEAAYAEGGVLTLEDAAALLARAVDAIGE